MVWCVRLELTKRVPDLRGPQTPEGGCEREGEGRVGVSREAVRAWGLEPVTCPAAPQLPGWGRWAGLGVRLRCPSRQRVCAGTSCEPLV